VPSSYIDSTILKSRLLCVFQTKRSKFSVPLLAMTRTHWNGG
jgi:hypothetical protein